MQSLHLRAQSPPDPLHPSLQSPPFLPPSPTCASKSVPRRRRDDLFDLLENPSSSRTALRIHVAISSVIVLATVLATIETVPSLHIDGSGFLSIRSACEVFAVIFFSTEYILRVVARSTSALSVAKFVSSPLGLLDILAIAPFYYDLLVTNQQADTAYAFRTTIVRVVRLFRLFRVFRQSSLVQLSIDVLLVAVRRSLDALTALLLFTIVFVVVFSTLLYFAERGTWSSEKHTFVDPDGIPSKFDSIPAVFWFTIVTLTTTGYGDMYPRTLAGKLISVPAMMSGILLIALPSIIIGRNFTAVWDTLHPLRRRQSSTNTINRPSPSLPLFTSVSYPAEADELDRLAPNSVVSEETEAAWTTIASGDPQTLLLLIADLNGQIARSTSLLQRAISALADTNIGSGCSPPHHSRNE